MSRVRLAAWLVAMIAWGSTGAALGQGHWGYSGDGAPQHWANLDPSFLLCGSGKSQSPIDLADLIKADLKPLTFAYGAGATHILNNGHTVQVDYAPGSSLSAGGRTFTLKQFHFHAPSENTIDGKRFPLEAHLVHADEGGNLAVVSVMFQDGPANVVLAKLWEKMPEKRGDTNVLPAGLSVLQLLPAERGYYRFDGSLTTPPCSEGVWWFVLKTTATASRAQIERLSSAIGHPNNRPIQPVNARPILR